MMVKAIRKGDVSREFIPQQSDYVRLWNGPAAVAQRGGSLDKLKSTLKGIRTLRSAFAAINAKARYRRLRIKRNARRILTPLNDLRVLH